MYNGKKICVGKILIEYAVFEHRKGEGNIAQKKHFPTCREEHFFQKFIQPRVRMDTSGHSKALKSQTY